MQNSKNVFGYKILAFIISILIILPVMFYPVSDTKVSAYQNSDFSDEYGDFLYALGESESGNNYSAVNGQYLGRWQIGTVGLQDIGFMDSYGNWTSLAASFGVTSKSEFLSSEKAQDYAVLASHKKVLLYAENAGITSYINTNVKGVNMTFAGMIVAAHAIGVGGLKNLILKGTSGYSSNDAVAVQYMSKYGIYDIENTVRYGSLPSSSGGSSATTTTTTIATTTTTTTTTTTAAVTTTMSTTTATTTTTSTALKAPSYISVKTSANVLNKGEILYISLDSDNASRYKLNLSSPNGEESEYIITGTSIGLSLNIDGIYTINVTGCNNFGESYAEPVYVAVKEKAVVSKEDIGDANMDKIVDIVDAMVTLRYYSANSSNIKLNEVFNKDFADVDGDGEATLADSLYILDYYSAISAGKDVNWDDIIK